VFAPAFFYLLDARSPGKLLKPDVVKADRETIQCVAFGGGAASSPHALALSRGDRKKGVDQPHDLIC
jgi:hypothetical protein